LIRRCSKDLNCGDPELRNVYQWQKFRAEDGAGRKSLRCRIFDQNNPAHPLHGTIDRDSAQV
jgi:hypothetical protein